MYNHYKHSRMSSEYECVLNQLTSITTEQAGWSSDPSLIVVNPYKTGTFELSDVDILKCLLEIDTRETRVEIESRLGKRLEISEEATAELFEGALTAGLLRSVGVEDGANQWLESSWYGAFQYHMYIRDYPFIDNIVSETEYENVYEMEESFMSSYSEEKPAPPVYKKVDRDRRINLPSPSEELPISFSEAIETSLYETSGSKAATLDCEMLSNILFFSFGETGDVEFPHQGRKLLKAVPSGGARHPTEGYLVVFKDGEIPAGCYHYSVRTHSLDQLSDDKPKKPRIIGTDFDPVAIIGCSSTIERSMWRYREPRTYRVLYHDVGHILESLRLISRGYGLSTLARCKFNDDFLEQWFGRDYFSDPIMAYMAIADN